MAREALLDGRFGLAEHKRNIWFATVPDDVEPEELLKPTYWSHIALQLRPADAPFQRLFGRNSDHRPQFLQGPDKRLITPSREEPAVTRNPEP